MPGFMEYDYERTLVGFLNATVRTQGMHTERYLIIELPTYVARKASIIQQT